MSEQDIYNRLNTSSVTAIVADRIHPTDPNENTNWPFVTYKTTGTQPVLSMAGSSPLALYAVEINIWCKSLQQQQRVVGALAADAQDLPWRLRLETPLAYAP